MSVRRAHIVLAASFAFASIATRTDAADATTTFIEPSPFAASAEIARRLLSPLEYARVAPRLAGTREMPIDPSRETFVVHVPPDPPPASGHGLLVFIPPWPDAAFPERWARALDRHGIVFVSAARSGNDADTLDRRVPLALVAAKNAKRRYAIDPARVFVGGFSGGSRVAMRVALAYPDVFRGALLDAGSDTLGGDGAVPPPSALMRKAQESTRLVMITGDRDEANVHNDLVSRRSLREACVLDVESFPMPKRGHEIADAGGIEHALAALEAPRNVDADALARCRAALGDRIAERAAAVDAALDAGDIGRATERLGAIDRDFGGLADEAIARLERRIAASSAP
jgi:predicted esterase